MKIKDEILLVSLALVLSFFMFTSGYSQPNGAKAIFESGEGPAVVTPVAKQNKQTTPKEVTQKYVGLSYQIMLLSPDGNFRPVSKARIFRSGERVKLIVRTNRPGYLTIMNIGPTGNTHLLFNEYVEAFSFHEIPKNTNLVFAGPPGTEKILIMLSSQPNPIVNPSQSGTVVQSTPERKGTHSSQPSSTMNIAQAPSANDISHILESAKGMRGAKDIILDDLNSQFAVITPQKGYRPLEGGAKDIMLESSKDGNYGVVPVSAVEGGGILTLQVNLKHR